MIDASEASAIEQRKRKAIEFLSRRRYEVKRDDQFTIRECAKLLNRKDTSSVYTYMNRLVAEGLWERGIAIDPESGKPVQVWWVKEE